MILQDFAQDLTQDLKVRLSPSKKRCYIYFNESPLKMMRKSFYSIFNPLPCRCSTC